MLCVMRRARLVKIGKISYGMYMYHFILLLLSDDIAVAFGLGGDAWFGDKPSRLWRS